MYVCVVKKSGGIVGGGGTNKAQFYVLLYKVYLFNKTIIVWLKWIVITE
jgi:hypothetical protein